MIKKNKKGFTLAEVLITLTVIGIIAAISLPALMQNINERAWDTKRKALHSRLSGAILSMDKIKGYGEYKTERIDDNDVVTDTQAESFVVEGLSKVYKIKNTCDSLHLDKCGLPKKLTTLQNSVINFPTSGFSRAAAGFETENGEKIAVYYNPNCKSFNKNWSDYSPNDPICLNFIYDLNGADSPNAIGKDMGIISALYSPEGLEVVAPNPYPTSPGVESSYGDTSDASGLCKSKRNDLTLPSIAESISITYNYAVTGLQNSVSGTIEKPGKNGTVWYASSGIASLQPRTTKLRVICVKG